MRLLSSAAEIHGALVGGAPGPRAVATTAATAAAAAAPTSAVVPPGAYHFRHNPLLSPQATLAALATLPAHAPGASGGARAGGGGGTVAPPSSASLLPQPAPLLVSGIRPAVPPPSAPPLHQNQLLLQQTQLSLAAASAALAASPMLPSPSAAVPPASPPATATAGSAQAVLAAAAASVDALTQRGIAAVAALLGVADRLASGALAGEGPAPAALASLAAEIRANADGVLDETWQIRSLARAWRGGGGGGGG